MPAYFDLSGNKVSKTDPSRGVWYSTACTFWTDDWDRVSSEVKFQIPTCPKCNAVGYQQCAGKWEKGIAAHTATEGNEHYSAFIDKMKGRCLGPGVGMIQAFAAFKDELKGNN